MKNNKISVTSDNIFPIIKKFLYSDQEVFLRELVSNAIDAIVKLKTLIKLENLYDIINDFKVKIIIDKKNNTLHILDNGIGMTEEEVDKYINQIAFSGAEEFIKKYKNLSTTDSSNIIGHFGLGFYSSFMVANKVMIFTQSYKKNASSIFWSCEGDPNFIMKEIEKKDRGTEIVLSINEENKEFLEYDRILKLLQKYCKFMPIKIFLSSKEEDKEKEVVINNINPAWKKNPLRLNDKNYLDFYHELYTNQLEDPLFWIHLNIDHPFHLTGILYFPKIEKRIDIQKNKIHLYQNQVYITDNLEGVVPDFLILLRGVIDSPDIPLNVSRSYLQSDASVKNISKYITRKVADKLDSMFRKNREDFQKKWKDIKIIVEYGMISSQNFFEKAIKFFVFCTVDENYFTLEEFRNKIRETQKNKEEKIVFLYSSHIDKQYSYIKDAKDRCYEVLILDSSLSVHLIQKLEFSYQDICFVRVDSDHIDKLINYRKEDKPYSELSEKEKQDLKNLIHHHLMENFKFSIQLEDLSKKDNPFLIIIPEFLRRIKEMNSTIGKDMVEKDQEKYYQLIVNANHILMKKVLKETSEEKRKKIIQEALNLALLSKGLLHGKNLTNFISKKLKDLIKGQE
ncbi:molecular chaperone HtpG [Blattabacterium cuenoti]|uniref:molecular chaperone HtpG n=1 Tax=Blattabacterium cuenoti TaxID=1653831 RepID=UPI00163BEB89|nr:molecular chaperone HtpG [Blattabacterium cuenoti]